MKLLNEIIWSMENLTSCDGTGYSYISDDDANSVIFHLKNYREVLKGLENAFSGAVKGEK